MHEATLKAWEFMSQWQEKLVQINESSIEGIGKFYDDIFVGSIQKMISECTLFSESLARNYPELSLKFDSTTKKMQHYQIELDFWDEIQKDYVTDRHWVEIFKLMKQDYIDIRKLTIRDIMELPVKLYSLEIREILNQAKNEYKYKRLLNRIKFGVHNIKLNVIKYKEYHILSEFDLT